MLTIMKMMMSRKTRRKKKEREKYFLELETSQDFYFLIFTPHLHPLILILSSLSSYFPPIFIFFLWGRERERGGREGEGENLREKNFLREEKIDIQKKEVKKSSCHNIEDGTRMLVTWDLSSFSLPAFFLSQRWNWDVKFFEKNNSRKFYE